MLCDRLPTRPPPLRQERIHSHRHFPPPRLQCQSTKTTKLQASAPKLSSLPQHRKEPQIKFTETKTKITRTIVQFTETTHRQNSQKKEKLQTTNASKLATYPERRQLRTTISASHLQQQKKLPGFSRYQILRRRSKNQSTTSQRSSNSRKLIAANTPNFQKESSTYSTCKIHSENLYTENLRRASEPQPDELHYNRFRSSSSPLRSVIQSTSKTRCKNHYHKPLESNSKLIARVNASRVNPGTDSGTNSRTNLGAESAANCAPDEAQE